MTQPHLLIEKLRVAVGGKEIVRGLDLLIKGGEIHAVMGPSGTGKSTLAQALMGHRRYEAEGKVLLDGQDLLAMRVDERARAGLFLAMQDPRKISGVSNANFLQLAVKARAADGKGVPVPAFHRQLRARMGELGLADSFADRSVNEGFSGSEKKRNEILQLAMLRPRIAILDEIDSDLDLDAMKGVAKTVLDLCGPELGVLIITRCRQLLTFIEPSHVHVMLGGRIVKSGGGELAAELERRGYDWLEPDAAEGGGGS